MACDDAGPGDVGTVRRWQQVPCTACSVSVHICRSTLKRAGRLATSATVCLLMLLFASGASAADTPCGQAPVLELCVSSAETPSFDLGSELTELVAEHACAKSMRPMTGQLKLSVTQGGLQRMLRALERQRISYASVPAVGAKPCAYRLFVLSHPGEMADAPPVHTVSASRVKAPPPRETARTLPLPSFEGFYVSGEDAHPAFERLKERFGALTDADKIEALSIMQEFHSDFGLEGASQLIERVARGSLQYSVSPAVAKRAREIMLLIDEG